MSLVVNGTTVAVSTSPNANGTAITKIVANGTTVWEKSTVQWTNIWSGNLYVMPTEDELYTIVDSVNYNGAIEGVTTLSAQYSGVSDTDITSDTLRGTGNSYSIYIHPNTGEMGQVTNGSMTHSSTATTSNFPWTDYGSQGEAITVAKPTSSGGVVTQSVTSYWTLYAGYVFVPYMVMTNLYKKG